MKAHQRVTSWTPARMQKVTPRQDVPEESAVGSLAWIHGTCLLPRPTAAARRTRRSLATDPLTLPKFRAM